MTRYRTVEQNHGCQYEVVCSLQVRRYWQYSCQVYMLLEAHASELAVLLWLWKVEEMDQQGHSSECLEDFHSYPTTKYLLVWSNLLSRNAYSQRKKKKQYHSVIIAASKLNCHSSFATHPFRWFRICVFYKYNHSWRNQKLASKWTNIKIKSLKHDLK